MEEIVRTERTELPLQQGTTLKNEVICFTAAVRKGNECSVLLFKMGEEDKKRIPMKRLGSGSIFSVSLRREAVEEYTQYLFEDEEGCFPDVYSGQICNTEHFGQPHGEIRSVIPKKERTDPAGMNCPAFSSLIFYKLHVRGFTMDASSGVAHKGTFRGVSEKIPYLKELGINAVLFQPVYEFNELISAAQNECGLQKKQLLEYEKRYGSSFVKAQMNYCKEDKVRVDKVNYWGYGSEAYYFSPKASYAADPENAGEELRSLSDDLHKAGIAVFFEFSFLEKTKDSLILDCFRYWTYVYGADGFLLNGKRTDLRILTEDPYLSGVKFLVCDYPDQIANGNRNYEERQVAFYQNDFRNVMRQFLKGDENQIGEFLRYFTEDSKETARVCYIADQNGFSLHDLYTYERKHNEENGEENRDGEERNYSWNCGFEGETTRTKIKKLRRKLQKNALCTVFLSRSTPLIFAGDELSATKKGNNNSYCQDNEVSYLNWRWNQEKRELFSFTKKLIAFRKSHSVLYGGKDIQWSDWKSVGLPDFSLHGVTLWKPDFAPYSRSVALLYCGAYAAEEKEEPDCFLCFNMHWEPLFFSLPPESEPAIPPDKKEKARYWEIAFSTSEAAVLREKEDGKKLAFTAEETEKGCLVPARSIVVLVRK